LVAPPFESADFSAGSIELLNKGPSFASYWAFVSGCPEEVVDAGVVDAGVDDAVEVELDLDEPPQPATASASVDAATAAPVSHRRSPRSAQRYVVIT
jgi:hypothetical protein